jgi:hypothetical protein
MKSKSVTSFVHPSTNSAIGSSGHVCYILRDVNKHSHREDRKLKSLVKLSPADDASKDMCQQGLP